METRGAVTIAADGSVINNIGTSGLAVNACDRGALIMIAAQTIKLHPDTLTGHTAENPAFDVTPPRYVDAIVTLMRELFGEATTEPWADGEAGAVR